MSGAFITSHSQHPQAAWKWLAFLSHQPTAPRYRLIPARASVAVRTAYWGQPCHARSMRRCGRLFPSPAR